MKILIPNFSCVVENPAEKEETSELQTAIDEGYTQIFIQTPKGIMKHHVLRSGKDGAARHIRVPVDQIPGTNLKKIEPEIKFLPAGKIPMQLLDEVKAFFREVIRRKGAAVEAMIWVLWSQEKGYYLHVPNQVVAHASANYDWAGLPSGSSIIVDIHSHADFNAFFSGTDDRDDANSIRFSVVIGHNNKPVQSIKSRFNYLGAKMDVEIADIFSDRPLVEVPIPEPWLEAVKTAAAPTPQTYGGRPGMDGSFRHPQYPGHTGPSYGHGASRYPSPFTERADREGNGTRATGPKSNGKAYYGGAAKAEKGKEGQSGLYEGPLTNPKVVQVGGMDYLDTGSGLIAMDSYPNVVRAEYIEDEATGDTSRDLDVLNAALQDLPPNIEQRMEAAAHRQAQEDLLSDAADKHLAELDSAGYIAGAPPGLDPADIPPEYDEICINHGKTVADAYAVIDRASTDLVESEEILGRTVGNLFQLVEENKKLKIFRALAELLPRKALENLAANGL